MVHHGAGLRTLTGSHALGRSLIFEGDGASVSADDRAMLRYVRMLTRSPAEVERADVDALRDVGFGDAAILDICQVTAYYNYVNRLADGLGVELEPYWEDADMVLKRDEFEALHR